MGAPVGETLTAHIFFTSFLGVQVFDLEGERVYRSLVVRKESVGARKTEEERDDGSFYFSKSSSDADGEAKKKGRGRGKPGRVVVL